MKSLSVKLLTASLCLTASILLAAPAMADSLIGDTVSGGLTGGSGVNVTTPFTSSAVVGSGVEFSGVLRDTSFNQTFDVAVDLSANSFTVSITSPQSISNIRGGNFYDITLSGLPSFVEGFNLTSYTCNTAVDISCSLAPYAASGLSSDTFAGSSLNLDFNTLANGQTYTFTAETAPAATPEPSSIALLGTGILGAAGAIRRRMVRA